MVEDKLVLITIKWGRVRHSRLYLLPDPDNEILHMNINLLRKEAGILNFKPDEKNIMIHFPTGIDEVPVDEVVWSYIPRSQREAMSLPGKIKVKRTGALRSYQLEPEEVADEVLKVKEDHPLWSVSQIAKQTKISQERVRAILQNESVYKARKNKTLVLVKLQIGKYDRSYVLLTNLDKNQIKEVLDSSLDELEESGKFDGTVDTSDALADKLREYGHILNDTIERIWDYEEEKKKEVTKWNKAVEYYQDHPLRLAKDRIRDWLWGRFT